MNESHFNEIEKAMLFISEARERAEKASKAIEKDGGELHLIGALRDAERELRECNRRLMQRTYFAVPDDDAQLSL